MDLILRGFAFGVMACTLIMVAVFNVESQPCRAKHKHCVLMFMPVEVKEEGND